MCSCCRVWRPPGRTHSWSSGSARNPSGEKKKQNKQSKPLRGSTGCLAHTHTFQTEVTDSDSDAIDPDAIDPDLLMCCRDCIPDCDYLYQQLNKYHAHSLWLSCCLCLQLASVILKQYVETHWCSQSEKFRPPETTDHVNTFNIFFFVVYKWQKFCLPKVFLHTILIWPQRAFWTKSCQTPVVPLQAKAAIRELLPGGLREAISKVRSSVAYAVSAIAHWDWPEAWPQLFTLLMEMLVSGNVNAVHGAMRVLTGM